MIFDDNYSPALKKWGLSKWGLYWICPVLPLFRNSAILLFRKSVTISFPLNILRTNGQNLTKFCIHINIDSIKVGIVNRQILQICNRVTALD